MLARRVSLKSMRGIGIRGAIRRSREGLSPVSQMAHRLGRTKRAPRFAGVALNAPDRVAAWGISRQISGGEYSFPGFLPQRGEHVIDIGANIGVFALWAARKGASVVCYEPSPETFDCLVRNAAGRSIKVTNAAVVGRSNGEQTVRLYLHEERSTRHTLLGHEIGSGRTLARHIDVPAVSIDEVLADDCDLLKVDCEGAEFQIFGEAEVSVLRRTRRAVVEFHRSVGDPLVLVRRFSDAGFDAQILSGADPSEAFGVIGARRID
jgi:FkbM family methyltransferase